MHSLMPQKVVLLLPQNLLAARHGDVNSRSICILGVSSNEDKVAVLQAAGHGVEMGRGSMVGGLASWHILQSQ
jgi:hypothetical protein